MSRVKETDNANFVHSVVTFPHSYESIY